MLTSVTLGWQGSIADGDLTPQNSHWVGERGGSKAGTGFRNSFLPREGLSGKQQEMERCQAGPACPARGRCGYGREGSRTEPGPLRLPERGRQLFSGPLQPPCMLKPPGLPSRGWGLQSLGGLEVLPVPVARLLECFVSVHPAATPERRVAAGVGGCGLQDGK